ncbi:hypothetical protein WH52_11520 [Tenacibaculum holothuriorum]|uniref:Tetratricopeptide repeat protein n=1 Tax=Tenacibaculum holothuriorum TaxID=1635173 RepID=A0A1Y2PCH0_9FLAO|nr:tetratricopeptide repeat protein [Tenacibaculum holothuriorum]OSY87487.1 hypothetical protein WH52_11520 [Tenacibaculum holothuriorum]
MKKKIILVVSILLFVKVEAQTSTFTSIDSLVFRGRYKQALGLLKSQPESFHNLYKTARIYDALDNYKKAAKNYAKAITYKQDYATKLKLATIYKKQGANKKAIDLYESIINNDVDNLLVKYQLGKLYLKTHQLKKAKTIFKELIKSDSQNANYSYQLGNVYALFKKRNLKINSYLDAYKKDKEHLKSIHQLAKSFTKLRDKDSARIFINRGLEVSPNHFELNKLKVNRLYLDKKYSKAIQRLKKLDTLKPKEFYVQKMLGRSFFQLKKLDSAKKYFNKAFKLDKSDHKSLEYLGDIAVEKKNYREAEYRYLWSIYTGREPRDKGFYGMGRVNLETGKKKLAIRFFKDAIEENGKNYRALYQLATTSDDYYQDKKIAFKHYQKYLEKFEKKDSILTDHVKTRIKDIKKLYFLKGEVLE